MRGEVRVGVRASVAAVLLTIMVQGGAAAQTARSAFADCILERAEIGRAHV